MAPLNYWEIYDGIPMLDPVYGDWSEDPSKLPPGIACPTRKLNNIDRYSKAQLQAVRRAHYACISHVDYTEISMPSVGVRLACISS